MVNTHISILTSINAYAFTFLDVNIFIIHYIIIKYPLNRASQILLFSNRVKPISISVILLLAACRTHEY